MVLLILQVLGIHVFLSEYDILQSLHPQILSRNAYFL
jgi:hypothetical protein